MRLITDVLRDIRRGKAVEVASQLLADVVLAVGRTNKKGSVTITLTVEPDEDAGNQVVVSVDVKGKIPNESVPTAIFFSDEAGNLHRSDPKQAEMFEDAQARAART